MYKIIKCKIRQCLQGDLHSSVILNFFYVNISRLMVETVHAFLLCLFIDFGTEFKFFEVLAKLFLTNKLKL